MLRFERSDQSLLEGLRSGAKERERAWEYIYKTWRDAIFYNVLEMGGSRDEARDALNNISMAFERTVTRQNFVLTKSLRAYLKTCVYHEWLWQQIKLSKMPREYSLEEKESLMQEWDYQLRIAPETRAEIERILKLATDEECKTILLKTSEGFKLEEIALSIGKALGSTKNKKTVCLQKLKAWLEANPKSRDYLKSLFND